MRSWEYCFYKKNSYLKQLKTPLGIQSKFRSSNRATVPHEGGGSYIFSLPLASPFYLFKGDILLRPGTTSARSKHKEVAVLKLLCGTSSESYM